MKILLNTFRDEVIDANNNTEISKDFDSSTKATKKLVTLECIDDNNNIFAISRWLTISSSNLLMIMLKKPTIRQKQK